MGNFESALTSLINSYSKENDSNTPDFILARFILGCLDTFNAVTNAREKWYGRQEEEPCTAPDGDPDPFDHQLVE